MAYTKILTGSDALYNYLSRLRQALARAGGIVLAREPGGYVLAADPLAVDLHRFHHLVTEARDTKDEDRAFGLLEQALGLWRGEAFAALDTPWVNAVRDTLDENVLRLN